MIQFDRRICCDLDAALSREWLETNGLGGFASSTIVGLNTRRYHGLLVAATKPPTGRMLLLSKLEETVVVGGSRYELGANQYPGAVHPTGYQYLRDFRLDPFPVFTYDVGTCEIEKSLFMVQGENSTVVRYRIRRMRAAESAAIFLEVRPLIGFRDFHATTHENGSLDTEISVEDGIVSVSPYPGLPHLHLAHDGKEVQSAGLWYRSFEYQVERMRGLEFVEDLFNPCVIRFEMKDRAEANIIASTERHDASRASGCREAEIRRRETLASSAPHDDELIRTLTTAADQFIVERESLKTVIAGYHWFGDWGRDTMIALPGLTLVTGRHDVARSILLEFARYVDRGMLPNRFPDQGEEPEYNTVDATLWFFEAVRSLAQYTDDLEFIRARLYPVLTDILEWHVRGTRYGIRVDSDGLLSSGEPGVQLTWMDAKVGDWVVTPRSGKPVEIQALWYNALRVLEELAHAFSDNAGHAQYRAMADRCKETFNLIFWNQDSGCLYDCIDGDERDGSIRPNQIIAVSLHHSMLSMDKAQRIVDVVERNLLTPAGLRTLAPEDSRYRPRYEGNIRDRDAVYHQGTVWAWLMGPFITAYVKAHGRGKKARRRAAGWLDGFRAHLCEAGLGQVSEIFDAEPPYTARGCIAQSWSVGELLRAAVEDVGTIH